MKLTTRLQLCVVLGLCLLTSAHAQSSPPAEVTLGFDGLPDLAANVDDFGVAFSGATVLACGGSLNCTQFPPFSGRNVIYDTPGSGGRITATFDPQVTGSVRKVSARVTGNRNITMTAFSATGSVLGTSSTGGANYVGAGTGLAPNALLTVVAAADGPPITRVTFQDGGNTFTVDDFSFTKGKIVMFDAGHGYIKVGNVFKPQREKSETYQLIEDDLTLDIVAKAIAALQSDYTVLSTRAGQNAPFAPANCGVPCNVDLDKRRELAEKYEVDALVSVHTNAADDKQANGTLAFYKGTGNKSVDLANGIVDSVVAQGIRKLSVTRQSMRVLTGTTANTLIEVAFHTNSQLAAGQTQTDEARLNEASFRSSVGAAIGGAVKSFIRANP